MKAKDDSVKAEKENAIWGPYPVNRPNSDLMISLFR